MPLVISKKKKIKKSQTNKPKTKNHKHTHIHNSTEAECTWKKKQFVQKQVGQQQQQNDPKLNIFCYWFFQHWQCEYTAR